jgi:hypothetical protein
MNTSKKNTSENPALGPRIPLTMDVDLPGLVESIATFADTPEKLVAFLKLLDAEYQTYDFTLAAGQWFVREIKESYAADGEKFDVEEVFAEALTS